MARFSPDSKFVRYEKVEDWIAVLTLNRPDRLNAYTPSMCYDAIDALYDYTNDDSLRVLILTGAGRGFCAGGDIKGDIDEFLVTRDKRMATFRRLGGAPQALSAALYELDKPVIAMVNGVAVSGGLAFALMCDYRVAAASARLGDPSGRAGLLPDEGGAWAFPRAMGLDHALKMVWLNEMFDAETALGLGLVSEVVQDEVLEARTLELARALAAKAPNAVSAAKMLMRTGLDSTLRQALTDAGIWAMWNGTQPDKDEGMAAFKERREPRFTGAARLSEHGHDG